MNEKNIDKARGATADTQFRLIGLQQCNVAENDLSDDVGWNFLQLLLRSFSGTQHYFYARHLCKFKQ